MSRIITRGYGSGLISTPRDVVTRGYGPAPTPIDEVFGGYGPVLRIRHRDDDGDLLAIIAAYTQMQEGP